VTGRCAAVWAGVAVVLALAAACERGGTLVGRPAPEFALSDLSGRAVRLANFQGQVVFLNVWATWCEPCRQEMPSMQELYERLGGPGFEILAVSADQGDGGDVREFVRSLGLTFPVLRDPEQQIASRYSVTGYPETFVIDRNGTVVEHAIGPHDWSSPVSLTAFRRLVETGEWRGL